MADLIKIKGGSGEVPELQDREPAVNKAEKELYIGINGENVRMCGANDVDEINGKIDSITTEIASINARLDALVTSGE